MHGSRHFDAHRDNGGNSSKRNDEETDCKTEKSNQNPISRAMIEDPWSKKNTGQVKHKVTLGIE